MTVRQASRTLIGNGRRRLGAATRTIARHAAPMACALPPRLALQLPLRILAAVPVPEQLALSSRAQRSALLQDELVRAEYRQLLDGQPLEGDLPPIAFWVSGHDLDLTDVAAACALARTLHARGHRVLVLGPDRWADAPADVMTAISTTPRVDAGALPGSAVAVGWVIDQVPAWLSDRGLPLYDLLLAGSDALAERLRSRFCGPLATLLPGPDLSPVGGRPAAVRARGPATVLVRLSSPTALPDIVRPRRASTARPVTAPLAGVLPDTVLRAAAVRGPVQILAAPVPPPEHLAPLSAGSATDPLSRRAALRRGRLLLLDRPPVDSDGLLDPVVGEALAAGVLPVVPRPEASAAEALVAAGLDRLPQFTTEEELRRLLCHHARPRHRAAAVQQVTASWRRVCPADPADTLLPAVAHAAQRQATIATIGFLPDFRASNPYQSMLYSTLPEAGIRVAPVRRPDRSLVLREREDLAGYALHVHWTSVVVQVAASAADAAVRLDHFREQVQDLQSRGGRLIWTVHNVLPHEVRYPELELALRRFLAERSDLVHVMSERTVALVQPHYRFDPATVVAVPHSSYLGIYPDDIGRDEARRRLGLADADVVLLSLGGIRPYRGLDTLVDAFRRLATGRPDLRLVIAGRPDTPDLAEGMRRRCESLPQVILHAERVRDEDLQVYHRAADLAVLPYRSILNSGSFKLAETFGLPIVAPSTGGLVAPGLSVEHTIGFDPEAPGDLLRALHEGVELATDPVRATAAHASSAASAAAYPPRRMSQDFAEALSRRCGLPPKVDPQTGANTDPQTGASAGPQTGPEPSVPVSG